MGTRKSLSGVSSRDFVCHLSLERCRHYLAHMQAIIHHQKETPNRFQKSNIADDSMSSIMAAIDRELHDSIVALRERS